MYLSAIEHCEEIFGYWPSKNLRPKNYLFSKTSLLSGKFEGHIFGEEQRQSGNDVGNYEGSPTSSQNFMNLVH